MEANFGRVNSSDSELCRLGKYIPASDIVRTGLFFFLLRFDSLQKAQKIQKEKKSATGNIVRKRAGYMRCLSRH